MASPVEQKIARELGEKNNTLRSLLEKLKVAGQEARKVAQDISIERGRANGVQETKGREFEASVAKDQQYIATFGQKYEKLKSAQDALRKQLDAMEVELQRLAEEEKTERTKTEQVQKGKKAALERLLAEGNHEITALTQIFKEKEKTRAELEIQVHTVRDQIQKLAQDAENEKERIKRVAKEEREKQMSEDRDRLRGTATYGKKPDDLRRAA